jgi:hypothetical protein
MPKINTITPKSVPSDEDLKIGTKEIRQAYFKNWYESCKDIYNKERRKKRKENKRRGKNNDEGNPVKRDRL